MACRQRHQNDAQLIFRILFRSTRIRRRIEPIPTEGIKNGKIFLLQKGRNRKRAKNKEKTKEIGYVSAECIATLLVLLLRALPD